MSKAELRLVDDGNNCTLYTIQFLAKSESEFEQFYNRFKEDASLNTDLQRIVAFIGKMPTSAL